MIPGLRNGYCPNCWSGFKRRWRLRDQHFYCPICGIDLRVSNLVAGLAFLTQLWLIGPIVRAEFANSDRAFATVSVFEILYVIVALAFSLVIYILAAKLQGRSVIRRIERAATNRP